MKTEAFHIFYHKEHEELKEKAFYLCALCDLCGYIP
jgi:hypothetical protein